MRRQRNRKPQTDQLQLRRRLVDRAAFDLTPAEVDHLLNELCVGMGFCISQSASQKLFDSSPTTIDAFIDGLFAAEGLPDPRGSLRSAVKLRVQLFIAARRAP